MVVAEEQEIEQLAKELLYTHCLEYWAVRFGNARVDLGSCDHRTQTITISRHHIKQHSPEQVRDTILHEIAHAMCRPGEGHGENWKAICRAIGARPERCSDYKPLQPPWKATCVVCGATYREILGEQTKYIPLP